MFTRTPAGFVDGRKKLQAMLTEVLENGSDPVTATRLWNMLAGPISAPLVDEENSTREVEEPGVFELLAEMEGAFPQLNALTDKSTQAMQKMTALAESATADLHTSDAAKGGFAGRLRIANRMATQLSPIADEFEEVADGFEQQIASIDAGMSCLLDLIEENPAQLKEMGAFPEILQTLVTNIRTANRVKLSSRRLSRIPASSQDPCECRLGASRTRQSAPPRRWNMPKCGVLGCNRLRIQRLRAIPARPHDD